MPCIESRGKLCVGEAEARGRPGGRSGRPGRPADGSSHFLTAEHDSGQTDFNFAETYLTLKRGIMKCNPSDSRARTMRERGRRLRHQSGALSCSGSDLAQDAQGSSHPPCANRRVGSPHELQPPPGPSRQAALSGVQAQRSGALKCRPRNRRSHSSFVGASVRAEGTGRGFLCPPAESGRHPVTRALAGGHRAHLPRHRVPTVASGAPGPTRSGQRDLQGPFGQSDPRKSPPAPAFPV